MGGGDLPDNRWLFWIGKPFIVPGEEGRLRKGAARSAPLGLALCSRGWGWGMGGVLGEGMGIMGWPAGGKDLGLEACKLAGWWEQSPQHV